MKPPNVVEDALNRLALSDEAFNSPPLSFVLRNNGELVIRNPEGIFCLFASGDFLDELFIGQSQLRVFFCELLRQSSIF